MIRNVDKHIKLITAKNRKKVRADISKLQILYSQELFETGKKLFQAKWREEAAFLNYFNNQWLNKNNGWFEGHSEREASTSNAIESTHKQMKDFGDMRSRHALRQFLQKIEPGLVHEWSMSRNPENNPNVKTFKKEPEINASILKKAITWKDKKITVIHLTNLDSYFTCDKKETRLDKIMCGDFISQIENNRHNNFDCFCKLLQSVHVIKLDRANWLKSSCSCSFWQKNYHCNHVIAICIISHLIRDSEMLMNVPLAPKKKKGNTKKTFSALNRQPADLQNEPTIDSDDELYIPPTQDPFDATATDPTEATQDPTEATQTTGNKRGRKPKAQPDPIEAPRKKGKNEKKIVEEKSTRLAGFEKRILRNKN